MTLRAKLRSGAIVLLMAYVVLRFFLVRGVFESQGVNPWVFLTIDALTAVVYVLGVEQLIVATRASTKDWARLLLWAVVAFIAFALPYLYIFLSSNQLPAGLGVGLGIVIILLLLNAILSLKRRIKSRQS